MEPNEPRNEPVFTEPWQAQAFAITVHLIDRGVFSAEEWSEALGDQRRQAGIEADGGDEYYRSWLNALEKLLTRKGLAEPAVLADLKTTDYPHLRPD